MRDIAQGGLRRLCSLELMRIGERAYACVPVRARHEAWFSLDVQRQLLFGRSGVDLVVDVGANTGQFAQALRRSYAGELLSFEPFAAAFEQLERAAKSDPLWHTARYALGRETERRNLKLSPLSVFHSFLSANSYCEERFGSVSRPLAEESVEIRRMDDAVEEVVPHAAQRRIFVKLDTQGFDLQVFAGLERLLGSVVGLQSEVSVRPLYDGMADWLESLAVYQAAGFRVGGLFPVVVDNDGLPIEYDCLMVRESGLVSAAR